MLSVFLVPLALLALAQAPSTSSVVSDQERLVQARRELEEARLRVRQLQEKVSQIEARLAEKAKTAACPAELGEQAGLIRHAVGERWKDGALPVAADLARWRCGCLEDEGVFKPAVLAGKVQFGELARVVVLPVGAFTAQGLPSVEAEALKLCLLGKSCAGQAFDKPRARESDGALLLGVSGRREWRLRRFEDALVLSVPSAASFGVSYGYFPARFCGP